VLVDHFMMHEDWIVVGSIHNRDTMEETVESKWFWIWRSCDRASLMYSFKYNQQAAALYSILYYCQCSTSAFLKLWSADHKWSSGSALVVLLDW